MDTELRTLVDLRDRVLQKSRIAFSNRLTAISNGLDEADQDTAVLIHKWHTTFLALEKEADKDIKKLAEKYEIIYLMAEIRGIGFLLAAKFISMIDIHRAPTVSSLWRYSGYGLTDGERDRPTKGEKLKYNNRLKTTCYLIGSSFLRSNSPYRKIYDTAREYYEINRPDWTKGHQHNAAMRKMIKLFLSHVWVIWRQIEGLEITEPYVHDRLNHTHYYTPQEFGWSNIA